MGYRKIRKLIFTQQLQTMKHKAILKFCLLFILASYSTSAYGQNSSSSEAFYTDQKELNLDQAISMALANNTEIKRALLAIDDANELVKIAYAEVLPDINSSVNYMRNIEIPVSFLPAEIFDPTQPPGTFIPVAFGTDNNWMGGFNVSQNIFKGEALVGIASSTVYKKVQEELYRASAQQIITQTRIAFYQALVAKENLRLQEAQIKRLEQNLTENESRLKAGLVEEYDVLRLRVQLSNQRPQLIEAEYALEESFRNLNVALGIPVSMDFSVKGNLNSFDILGLSQPEEENVQIHAVNQMNPYIFDATQDSVKNWASNRGDLRVIDSRIDLKDKEIFAIKSRFLPTVSASYGLNWNAVEPGAITPFENAVRSQTLGVSVQLPIFQGLQRISNVNRAKIQRKDLLQQKRQAMLNAENEVTTAKENLNKAFETADSRKLALKQAERGYEIAKARFDNGLGSQLDVTEAEIQVRQAELNYALMVFNYLTAKAQYDLALGQVPFIDIQN